MRHAFAAVLVLFAVGSACALETSAGERAKQVLSRRPYQLELPKDSAVEPIFRFGSLGLGFTRLIGGLGYVAVLVAAGALIFALVHRRDGWENARTSVPPRDAVVPAF